MEKSVRFEERSETQSLLEMDWPDLTTDQISVQWDPSFLNADPLIMSPEHDEQRIRISEVVKEAASEQPADRPAKVAIKTLKSEVLQVAQVGLEDLAQEETRVTGDMDLFAGDDAKGYEEALYALQDKEKAGEAHILKQSYNEYERSRLKSEAAKAKDMKRNEGIEASFIQSEKRMKQIIKLRAEHTYKYFGILDETNEEKEYSSHMKRLFSKWKHTPQPLSVRIEQLRCVKDKLPCAHYVILISIWDRLGGNPVEFQKITKNSEWKRVTIPKRHGGRHFCNSLNFEENLKMLGPSPFERRPTMVLVFELFMLRSKRVNHDKCVAHGIFPLTNSDFEYCEGKFKVPMITSDIDLSIDRFSDLEALYAKNIDHWLCNLYFQIRKLKGKNSEDFAKDLFQIEIDDQNAERTYTDTDLIGSELYDNSCLPSEVSPPCSPMPSPRGTLGKDNFVTTDIGSHTDRYKELKTSATNVDRKKTEKPDPEEIKYEPLVNPEQFEEYRFSVTAPDGLKSRHTAWLKLKYILSEVWSDMGLRGFRNAEFWISFLIICMTCWVSRFTHYIGQWFLLTAKGIHVQNFEATRLTIDLDYASDVSVDIEIGVIIMGTVFSLIIFIVLAFISWVIIKRKWFFPSIAFRMILCFGLAVTFDWVLVTIESLWFGYFQDDWKGDLFKLYTYYHRNGDYGVLGVVLTFFIFLSLMLASMVSVYVYIRYAHMNGRVMDVYTRITGPDNIFFVPYDGEVSQRYLTWICKKAKNYKNFQGDSRKIAFKQYVQTDESDASFEEITTHILIYNVSKDKQRSVYRQFIKLPNGSISEVGVANAGQTLERQATATLKQQRTDIQRQTDIFAQKVKTGMLTKRVSTRQRSNVVSMHEDELSAALGALDVLEPPRFTTKTIEAADTDSDS